MKQINLNVTPEFERNLNAVMRTRGIASKSDAIRIAVREAAERLKESSPPDDFREWIGIGLKAPLNHTPRFKDEDALWS
jgi:Arc/MetJ-type ribon-helix-helix transcriptional regulator